MARRRSAAVDTSDPLSTGVLVAVVLVAAGALAGLFAFNVNDTKPSLAAADQVVASDATRVPVPAASAGQDIDGDGDTAVDDESGAQAGDAPASDADGPTPDDGSGTVPLSPGVPGRAEGSPTPAPDPSSKPATSPTPAPEGGDDADDRITTPDQGGLFSPDDPARVPAITVSSTPRDELFVQVDLDGDGRNERVRAAIVRDQVMTRVEHVVDGAWVADEDHRGAAADRLVALRAVDLTGDGEPEVYTRQWVANDGESITLWAYRDGDLARMQMTGGCWNDTNTIGITGALVRARDGGASTLVAVCRDEGLPPQQWSSAVYVWEDDGWEFARRQGTYQ